MIHYGEGNDNPLQYFCLENPLDREAWWVTVHGVVKSRTRLKQLNMYTRYTIWIFISMCLQHWHVNSG